MSSRVGWLDFSKGIGIGFVVVYHSLEGLLNSFGNSQEVYFWASFFRAWLMPFFFAVSGYLVFVGGLGDKNRYLTKIFDFIYIYVLWSFVIYLVRFFASSFTNTVIKKEEILYILWNPVPTIWFIYALLLSFALTVALRKTNPLFGVFLGFVLNVSGALFFDAGGDYIVSRFCWVYVFFAVGFFVGQEVDFFNRFRGFFSVAGVLVFWGWFLGVDRYFGSYWVFFKPINSLFMAAGFLVQCYFVFKYLRRLVFVGVLEFFGSISLYVYLVHFPIPSMVRIVLVKTGFYNSFAAAVLPPFVAFFVAYSFYYLNRHGFLLFLFSRPRLLRRQS